MKSNRHAPFRFVASLCAGLLVTQSTFATTDLQVRMNPSLIERKSLAKKYDLTRLWSFENANNFQDDVVMGDGRDSGSKLLNREININAVRCQASNKSYAYFNKGLISSDETLLIEDAMKDVKPTAFEDAEMTAKKGWDLVHTNFPNFTPSSKYFNPSLSGKLTAALAKEKNRQEIQKSTSLVEVKQDKRSGQYVMNSSDYTVGGWFKPKITRDGSNTMTLLTKKFSRAGYANEQQEWKVFFSGNILYFSNFFNGQETIYSKYLSNDDAAQFRNQPKNIPFYNTDDYYADVLAKPVVGQKVASQPVPLSRILLSIPAELPQSKKPVPPIGPTPPVNPPGPPTVPPVPPGPIPTPPTVPPVVIVPDPSGKQHIADFDMKHFWWAATLGSCYGCVNSEQHMDAWYYVSLSVHLNDPLGPYVDITMVQDPNDKFFGKKSTLATNVKTARWELERAKSSRTPMNPVTESAKLEKGCTKSTCVESTLEIGNSSQNEGYTGFMRGVYITKKALTNSDVLDLAAQFYPNDSEQCTYLQKGP